ncbi:hypothetical protein ANN_23968 [Periplaneta americana]|uniref:Uncharacterized protein n=1 Tax=Periplaneta americana TaxID=6978 RepID=A0ABQ8S279_PERAM|nr:hypothetical protein ANN_23968 [Periplaneta americana]
MAGSEPPGSLKASKTHFDIGCHARIPTRNTILRWVASFRITGSTLKKKSPGRNSIALRLSEATVRSRALRLLSLEPFEGVSFQVNKETGCSSINGTSTNDSPVKRKLQGRRKTTVPVSDYESDEIELDTDYDVSGVLSIFTDSESDMEKKTKSVKLMLKAHTKVVALIEGGNSQRYVTAVLGIPRSTVQRVYHRFRETGDYSRKTGLGRK